MSHGRSRRGPAPYAGRTPTKADNDVDEFGPARGNKLAKKMPADTSPTPPGRTKVTPEVSALSPSAPKKDQDGEIEARLQSLELGVANLNANLQDQIQTTVGAAVLAAFAQQQASEQAPLWASELQSSVLKTDEKVRACEGQIVALQTQVEKCVINSHPIYLAERAAMLTTAAQTRISMPHDQDGEKLIKEYLKKKFPDVSNKIPIAKSGSAFVATFDSVAEAKKVAKALKVDCKEWQIRPQLPALVLESQGPLKRAFAALKAFETAATPNLPPLSNIRIDYKVRVISDGERILARQFADGCIQPNIQILGMDVSNAMLHASQDREYFFKSKDKTGKGQLDAPGPAGKSGKGTGKGKGKGKKGKKSDMDVDDPG